MEYEHILVEEAAPFVRHITLNRPGRRNAISNALRGARAIVRTGADLQAGPHIGAAGASGAELSALVKATQKRT